MLLRQEGLDVELRPIRHDPDEAGLLGGAHLAPSWVCKGHDSILAMVIGGTNARVGLVLLNQKRTTDLSRATVEGLEHWRHRDDEPPREKAVDRLIGMLKGLIKQAEREGHDLASFIAVGCPGVIAADRHVARGGQNLTGNWADEGFHLPGLLAASIPRIGEHETQVV